jgi:hypothetical protein
MIVAGIVASESEVLQALSGRYAIPSSYDHPKNPLIWRLERTALHSPNYSDN